MKIDDTNVAVIGHHIRAPIKLGAKQLSAGGKIECIIEHHATRHAYSRCTDPTDFGVTVDNDRRGRIGKVLQENKIIAQSSAWQPRLQDGGMGVSASVISRS